MGQAHMYNLHKKIQACAWYFFPSGMEDVINSYFFKWAIGIVTFFYSKGDRKIEVQVFKI